MRFLLLRTYISVLKMDKSGITVQGGGVVVGGKQHDVA